MRYDVTFQVDGEERTEQIDAPDAAAAAATAQSAFGREADLFELIQVHLLDEAELAALDAEEASVAEAERTSALG